MAMPTKLYALCFLLLAFLFSFFNSLKLDKDKLYLPEKHASLFIFGDSYFDAGNNNYINTTTGFRQILGHTVNLSLSTPPVEVPMAV
jgi:hypothetical protein